MYGVRSILKYLLSIFGLWHFHFGGGRGGGGGGGGGIQCSDVGANRCFTIAGILRVKIDCTSKYCKQVTGPHKYSEQKCS